MVERNLASLKVLQILPVNLILPRFVSVIWEGKLLKLKCDKGYSQVSDVEGISSILLVTLESLVLL